MLARRGQAGKAETLAREALRITSETDALNNQAKALIDLSEVLQLVGRSEEAWMTVQQAMETFESKGNTVEARRARALLVELALT